MKKKIASLDQKYALYGIPVKSYAPRGRKGGRKKEDIRAENIEEGNIVSQEQVLTTPSTGNSRRLKRTYAMAGQ
jgi:hypothetical protein